MDKELKQRIESQLEKLKRRSFANGDYDEFGASIEYMKNLVPLAMFFYEKWFRVEIEGIENIPTDGPALIIGNHSGQIPMDGTMITIGCLLEMGEPRLPRTMVEKWFPTMPFVGTMFTRAGQLTGLTENAERLLEKGELMMIFPEGAKGSGKTWEKRYKLQRFTLGFMELSIKYNAPIIPVSVIGGEEQAPSFVDVQPLAKAFNMPYFPLTPTFPWTGIFGFIPYPSKYRITFGKPMDFSKYKDQLEDPDRVRAHVEEVKAHIQNMIDEGLKKRPFPGL